MCNEQVALAQPQREEEQQVSYNHFDEAHLLGYKTIDGTNGNNNEKIGHFAYCNLLGAVANDAENRKESQRKACLKFNAAQQIDEQEDTDCYKSKCKEIVATLAFGVVEETNDDTHKQQVQEEECQKVQRAGQIEERACHCRGCRN